MRYIRYNYEMYHVYLWYICEMFQIHFRDIPTLNFSSGIKHLHTVNIWWMSYLWNILDIYTWCTWDISDISYLSTHVVHMSWIYLFETLSRMLETTLTGQAARSLDRQQVRQNVNRVVLWARCRARDILGSKACEKPTDIYQK